MRKLILLTLSVAIAVCCFGVNSLSAINDSKTNIAKLSLKQVKNLVQNKQIDRFHADNDFMSRRSGVGEKKILVLPCFFDDVKYTYVKKSLAENFESGKTRNLQDYYAYASDGKMPISFGSKGISDWLRMPKKYADYQTVEELAIDGLNLAVANGYNLSEYDQDGNGQPDYVIYVWAGNSWTVGGEMPGDFTFPMENYGNYIMIGEDVRFGFSMITVIHECAHQLIPLWDTYDYSYTSVPVGSWDLMADGVWNGNCGLPAYQRWKAGWMEPITITEPGTYYIDDLNGEGTNKMYKIPIPGSDDEWICVENRSRKLSDGYFQGAPETGFVAYHVDDKRGYEHRFNTLGRDRDGVVWRTHGFTVLDPSGSNLHRSAMYGKDISRTKITALTTPNTLPYRKGNSDKTLSITEISERGPRMSFKVDFVSPDKPIVSAPQQVVFGKIVKGRSATKLANFRNVGVGKLFIQMKPSDNWISLDRNSFIGNDEDVNITIDTSALKIGKYTAKINFINQSTDTSGYIELIFEVVPIEGDINGDGKVNQADIDEFIKRYGKTAEDNDFKAEFDFNSDGVIDIVDFMLLAKNFYNED